VALLGFAVDAAGENLDASFNDFEPCTSTLEPIVDGMWRLAELAFGCAGKQVKLFGDIWSPRAGFLSGIFFQKFTAVQIRHATIAA